VRWHVPVLPGAVSPRVRSGRGLQRSGWAYARGPTEYTALQISDRLDDIFGIGVAFVGRDPRDFAFLLETRQKKPRLSLSGRAEPPPSPPTE
jgi:hypothetical protein